MEEDQELQNPFPSPPSHYTKYTSHNLNLFSLLKSRLNDIKEPLPTSDSVKQQHDLLANEKDVPDWPLSQLEKPRVDWILEEGMYNAFGDTWFTKEQIPSLAEMGGTQLYPEDPIVDRRPALQSILKTLLRTYSAFLSSIISPPPPPASDMRPDWQRLVEWMGVMGQNIMGAANDLRPVQARGNLEAMMTRQLELRREETKAIHAKCDALEAKLEQLRIRAAALSNPQLEEPERLNPESDINDTDMLLGDAEVSMSPAPPTEEHPDSMEMSWNIDNENLIRIVQITEEEVFRWAEEAG